MVGKTCTVCRRSSYNEKHLSFFTYPSDAHRRLEWLMAVNRLDLEDKVNDPRTRGNHRICEVHFEKKYIRISNTIEGRKSVTKDACPTLYIDKSARAVPKKHENFKKPPKMNMQNVTARNCHQRVAMDCKRITVKKENTVQVKNWQLRSMKNETQPFRQESASANQIAMPVQMKVKPFIKEVKPMRLAVKPMKPNLPFGLTNEVSIKIRNPTSPPPCPDMSELCESIIKVSKSSQTLITGHVEKIDTTFRCIDKKSFLHLCSKYLPRSLFKTIQWNLTKGKNINFMLFALNLYYTSKSYNLIRDMLSLPSKESLKHFLLPMTTKLSDNFVNALRCKVNNMSIKEKVCSFSVGSVPLKPNLYYDIKRDRIIGLHDVNGLQNCRIAKYAIVFMLQGIIYNWKQPIVYAFISEFDNDQEISTLIDDILMTLIDIGFNIRTFVSDPRIELLYQSHSRSVTPEKPYFTVNGVDIFYTYDTTQLLNIVKNNLNSCDIYYSSGSEPNTNGFLTKLSNLNNMLNTKSRFANTQYKRAFSNKNFQRDFLEEMLEIFRTLRVVRRYGDIDVTKNMKFVVGYQLTIKSVIQLFEELNFMGAKYLLTSRLGHACFNKLIIKLKGVSGKEESTARQFHKCFVRSLIFNMLKRPSSDNDLETSLESEEFYQYLLEEEFQNQLSSYNQPLNIYTTDYREEIFEKDAFLCICNYCYRKCIELHCCDILKSYQNYLNYCRETQENNLSLGSNVDNHTMQAPDSFIKFIMAMEIKLNQYFTYNRKINSVGQEILETCDNNEFEMPCQCFPIDYLKSLFIRVRLFYMIKKNNNLLKRKKDMKSHNLICSSINSNIMYILHLLSWFMALDQFGTIRKISVMKVS